MSTLKAVKAKTAIEISWYFDNLTFLTLIFLKPEY